MVAQFQSTRPMRGATLDVLMLFCIVEVSIHAPHTGRDHGRGTSLGGGGSFNPRAPCGARPNINSFAFAYVLFQSTRPVWGATLGYEVEADECDVSIHAPRVGRDCVLDAASSTSRCFNPRAPCGARLWGLFLYPYFDKFQSTRPVWGATLLTSVTYLPISVSIHAPRVGRDIPVAAISDDTPVSIHAPRVGRDIMCARGYASQLRFNPRAPCGA